MGVNSLPKTFSVKCHYTDPTGPDLTRQSPRTLSETRVSDKVRWVRLVEFWNLDITRQRPGCDLNPGHSAPESSTLTTRLPSHQTPL